MGPFTHQPGRVTVAVQQLANNVNDVWLKQPAGSHQLVRADLVISVQCAEVSLSGWLYGFVPHLVN